MWIRPGRLGFRSGYTLVTLLDCAYDISLVFVDVIVRFACLKWLIARRSAILEGKE